MPINYKDYPPNWHLYSRFVIKIRAKNHCEKCGVKNGNSHPFTGKKQTLSAAHLDHNRYYTRLLNLIALCNYCHLNYDRPINNVLRRVKGTIPLFPDLYTINKEMVQFL